MRETTDVRLLACPFCGGENVKTFGPYGWYRQYGISHSCKSFYSGSQEMFKGFGTKEQAIAAWNRRAAPEPAPKPAGGEWVSVPRADVEFIVRTANRNERTEEGDRLAVLLSTAPTPPAVDAQDVGELLDGFKDVLSHLVAAHSLLSRSPKTGAASNKMFDQMLKDYSASIERGRKLYAAYKRSTTNGQS